MDLTEPTIITSTPTTAPRTTSDSDVDTPPRPTPTTACTTKPTGFLAYANGAPNRHPKQEPFSAQLLGPPPGMAVSYKECMRNHAASIGGHALDGCCEFMPSPVSNPADPISFRCAACGCHRNFHRRDPDDPAPLHQKRRHPPPPPPPRSRPELSPLPPATSSFYSSVPHMLVALKKNQLSGSPAPATAVAEANGGGRKLSGGRSGKKRFRTKFSQEQKDKMYEFSEKLGWKMQRIDKRVVEEFCNEVGVGKEVLKVWMHNNKNTLGRRESGSNSSNNNNKQHHRNNGARAVIVSGGNNNGNNSTTVSDGVFYCSSNNGGGGGDDGGGKEGVKAEIIGGSAHNNGSEFEHFQVVSANNGSSSSS